MNKNYILQNLAYTIIIIIGFGSLLYIGASVILPFLFATFFAIFLYPIDRFIFEKVRLRWLSILLSYLCIFIPIVLVIALFYLQLSTIVGSLPAIGDSLKKGFTQVVDKVEELIPFLDLDKDKILNGESSPDLKGPLSFIGRGIVSTTGIMAGAGLTLFYSFFILYYRKSFKNFIIYQFEKSSRPDIKETLTKIKETVQSYIRGLGIVTVLLATLNTIGLYFIGIDYPIFWGVLGGILAVIPYVGTLISGLLPFLYALATTDQNWQPAAVIIYYITIQQVEGNFITPKIVGDKVNINPLMAIMALIFFGSFWGIGGVLLALPITSIIRIIFGQFESTESIALLMSSDIHNEAEKFKDLPSKD